MALGRRCSSMKASYVESEVEECMQFEFVRCSRSFGRKRISISQNLEFLDDMEETSPRPRAPLKRLCSVPIMAAEEKEEEIQTSGLDNLPQDLLIKILCGVNHEDLKQLLLVSKPIAEATSIAKRLHFAYSTPTKVRAFRSSSPVNFESEAEEIETPGAPLRGLRRYRPRLNMEEASEVSIALFGSPKKKKGLFMDFMEM
ncbi:F-box protein At1g61340 [Linum perenne]